MTPAQRLAAILVLAVLAGGIATAQDPPTDSSLPSPADDPLDTDQELGPAQEEALEARDDQELEEARDTGGSHLDTLTGEATATATEQQAEHDIPAAPPSDTPAYGTPATDPVIRTPSEALAPAYGDYGAPAARPGQDLGDLLAILIQEWSREPAIRQLAYGSSQGVDEPAAAPAGATAAAPSPLLRAIAAGRPFYARTLYEVNSDFPGPVLVEILDEPLAGAVATGGFEVVRDRMVLRLTTLEHEGTVSGIDGWAVDLDCACFGVEGEVDRHWLDRVILPAAIAFAEGWTAALGQPSTTVTVQGDVVIEETGRSDSADRIYEGIAAATGQIGRVLTEDSASRMTVRIPRNTALAVTFASSPAAGGLAAEAGQ